MGARVLAIWTGAEAAARAAGADAVIEIPPEPTRQPA
jgi:hypothetical protein